MDIDIILEPDVTPQQFSELAVEAEKLGMVIGDEAVLQHLTQHLSDDTITRNELAAILQRATGGNMTQQHLFDRLRTELMAHQLRIIAKGAAFDVSVMDTSVSPGASFAYFKRLHRRMVACSDGCAARRC